jgi:photosystem II stability/assembly factor-like uncharacterized protein
MINMARKLLPPLLLLTLLASILPFSSPVTAIDAARWTPVTLPARGQAGKWVLADASDIRHLTAAADGTLYCYADPTGANSTLFKSKDSGRTWAPVGKVIDVIIDITVLTADSTNVYYATSSGVYKSNDAGNTFIPLPAIPGVNGGNIQITSVTVTRADKANLVAISTADSDSGHFGGVFLLDESQVSGIWINTNIGNYDVYRTVFSPNYLNDRQLTAVASDETDALVCSRIYNLNWDQTTGIARIRGIVPAAACIAFPDGFNGSAAESSYFLSVATGTDTGGVFQITNAPAPGPPTVKNLNIGAVIGSTAVDISSLAVNGDSIIAGTVHSVNIFLSSDRGTTWTVCRKPPTGQTDTCLVTAADFAKSHRVFAVTCGGENAFSCSQDGGNTWNQCSLINTEISDISALSAPQDNTCFMLTWDNNSGSKSLWRTVDLGLNWDRIFCSSFAGINDFTLLAAAPPNSASVPAIFLAGMKDNNPVIWKSTDNGQSFVVSGAPYNVDAITAADANTWFIGGLDNAGALICRLANGGTVYSDPAEAGTAVISSLALSPSYAQDKTVLAGNITGQVFISNDNGAHFDQIGQALPLNAGLGRISVAFDSKYSQNKTIYAAVNTTATSSDKNRIFRFTAGKDNDWQSINSNLPDSSIFTQITVSGGTLYAVNNCAVSVSAKQGGVVRVLDGTAASAPFDVMLTGLNDLNVLDNLCVCGNQIWAVDHQNRQLLIYYDTLAQAAVPVSPVNQAVGIDNSVVNLKWQPLTGASEYQWQVSDNPAFTGILTGLSGTSDASTARVTGLDPAAKYYWRVRASKPALSRWSETWSFNTVLGGNNALPVLAIPAPGATTGIKPVFQWSPIPAADCYDFQLAQDAAFTKLVIDKTGDKAVAGNACESEVNLENGNTYYWRVKARSVSSTGVWSPVSVFVTEPVPAATTPVYIDKPTQLSAVVQTTPQVLTSTVTVQVTNNPQPAVIVNMNLPTGIMYAGIAFLAAITITLVIMAAAIIKRR